MLTRILGLLSILLYADLSHAQSYQNDSLSIIFNCKNAFEVSVYQDLDISIDFVGKAKDKVGYTYDNLFYGYKSPLGTFYYDLLRLDSATGIYEDFTRGRVSSYIKQTPAGADFITFDFKKTPLRYGQKKTFRFNVLDFNHVLPHGEYSMVIYLRTGNNYGRDVDGRIITNSIFYLGSKIINFKVTKDIENHVPIE